MSAIDAQRRELLLAGLGGALTAPVAVAQSSGDSPAEFWSRLTGTWRGELSYLDGNLEPIIQTYHAVAELALGGAWLSQTEYKFYPPGTELAANAAGGNLPADQGIEVITGLAGDIEGGRWTLGADDVYQLVDAATIVRHARDPHTGVPRYVTYWTLTSARTLLITNLGILFTRDEADYYNRPLEPRRPNARLGELKGCSVFRYIRMEDGQRDQERQRLRERHNVTRSVDRRPAVG